MSLPFITSVSAIAEPDSGTGPTVITFTATPVGYDTIQDTSGADDVLQDTSGADDVIIDTSRG